MVKVGILGSGPCGLISALILLKKGLKVTILDIGSSLETPNNEILKFNLLKTNDDLNYYYDINQFEKIYAQFDRKFFSSKALFGFSKVWGGTWEPNFETVDPKWQEAFEYLDLSLYNDTSKIFNSNQIKCQCFDENFKIYQKLTISNFKLRKTNNLFKESNKTDINELKIWDAEVLYNECLKYDNFNYINDFHLKKLIVSDSILTALSFKEVSISFDKFILAGGPISNSAIILRSNLANEIILNDTKLCYVPYFNFKNNCDHPNDIFWSKYSANIKFDNGLNFFVQIHTDVKSAILRLTRNKSKLVKLIANFFFKITKKRLGVMLIYFDSRITERLKFKIEGNCIILTKISAKEHFPLKNIALNMVNKFIKIGVVPLWMFSKVTSVGESYHLGTAKGLEFTEEGNLLVNKNIYVVGSFSLSELNPGPITKSAMAQAYIATKSLLKSVDLE